jgi:hypothetical protein
MFFASFIGLLAKKKVPLHAEYKERKNFLPVLLPKKMSPAGKLSHRGHQTNNAK